MSEFLFRGRTERNVSQIGQSKTLSIAATVQLHPSSLLEPLANLREFRRCGGCVMKQVAHLKGTSSRRRFERKRKETSWDTMPAPSFSGKTASMMRLYLAFPNILLSSPQTPDPVRYEIVMLRICFVVISRSREISLRVLCFNDQNALGIIYCENDIFRMKICNFYFDG